MNETSQARCMWHVLASLLVSVASRMTGICHHHKTGHLQERQEHIIHIVMHAVVTNEASQAGCMWRRLALLLASVAWRMSCQGYDTIIQNGTLTTKARTRAL